MGLTSRVTITSRDNWQGSASQDELALVPRMTQKEMREVMKSEEYKTSSKCRELVRASIQKGIVPDDGPRDIAGNAIPEQASGDMIAARMEHVKSMFRNPEYQRSAMYRYEVQQKLANLTANDNHQAINPREGNQSLAVAFSPLANQGSTLAVRKFGRVQMEPSYTTGEAPAKPAGKPTEAFPEAASE